MKIPRSIFADHSLERKLREGIVHHVHTSETDLHGTIHTTVRFQSTDLLDIPDQELVFHAVVICTPGILTKIDDCGPFVQTRAILQSDLKTAEVQSKSLCYLPVSSMDWLSCVGGI